MPFVSNVQIGERNGNLTVIGAAEPGVYPNGKWRMLRWLCRCDCGAEIAVPGKRLRKQQACYDCGRKNANAKVRKHGDTAGLDGGPNPRLYSIWAGMRDRCSNPNHDSFKWYGGKGIAVCPEWQEWVPFRDWALANGYQADLTIDRIHNDRDYGPGNCRWITNAENAGRALRGKKRQWRRGPVVAVTE